MFQNVSNADLYSEPYVQFIRNFASITPDFSHYFFISGGTLAVENALKAAFDWKAQKLGWDDCRSSDLDVIHLKEAFHGRSGYCLSLTNTGIDKTKWFPQFNWTRIKNPKVIEGEDTSIAEEESLTQAEQALKSGKVAAIILEPIQGEGGDSHFRPDYLQALRNLADKYEAMLIFDEVQTGMGMTGKMWCYEHFGVKPDILCFGKKAQVCGICSTNRIDDVPNNVFHQSGRINSTWGGNLIDMVRASIYIDIIKEDNLVENARIVGEYFVERLKELPLKNVRGRGLVIAFDVDNRDEFLKRLNEKIFCLKCGPKSIRFRPHLTIGKKEVDFAIKFMKTLF